MMHLSGTSWLTETQEKLIVNLDSGHMFCFILHFFSFNGCVKFNLRIVFKNT